MTESSEQRLRAERGGKRLRFTRRRRLRRGVKPRSEATSTGQPGRRADEQLRCTELPACRRPRAARHRPKPWGHPNCSRGTIGSEAPSSEDTGNRVSVNGARTLVRATGAGSSFGNGGRFADKTGSKRHRCRATGSGAIGNEPPGNRRFGANMGIARRALGHDGRCVGRAKANARRSTSGGSSHLSGSPGWVRRRKQAAPPGATHFFGPAFGMVYRLPTGSPS